MPKPFSSYIQSYELKGCHLFLRDGDGQSWDISLERATARTHGTEGQWEIVHDGQSYRFDPNDNPSGLTLLAFETMLGAC